jgi:hypothetical protein
MSPAALLDRQLARLSGIEAEVIRHRRFTDEHACRLDAGIATVESFVERLAFLEPPFDLANVAHAADAHGADVVVLDYLQRIMPPGDVADPRLRANAVMGMLRQFAGQGCAVLALSAVGRSRDNAGRSTYAAGSMSLASFRDSGELEYGADDAFLLAPVDDADPSVVRLSHLKCRHGAQRTVDLALRPPTASLHAARRRHVTPGRRRRLPAASAAASRRRRRTPSSLPSGSLKLWARRQPPRPTPTPTTGVMSDHVQGAAAGNRAAAPRDARRRRTGIDTPRRPQGRENARTAFT